MAEAVSNVLSELRETAGSMPSAGDAREAVRSHLPSVDLDGIRSHLPSLKKIDAAAITDRVPKPHGKKPLLLGLFGVLAAVAAVTLLRRRNSEAPASIYTPPLPKP